MSFNPPPPPGMEPGSSSAYLFYGAPDGAVAAPLPLGEAIRQLPGQYWKALTRPGASAFAEETGKASWDIVLVQLAGYAIIAAILALLNYAFTQSTVIALLNQLSRNTGTRASTPPAFLNSPVLDFSITIIGIPIGFIIGQVILFRLAKAFGGQGTSVQQVYTFLLFQVPLGILGSLLGLIPIGGPLFSLAASIYSIVLSVFAIMGVHQLTGSKASGVVLIPIGVVFLLVCCGTFLILYNPNLY